MRKLGLETHFESVYAMYIAIAPRDPREPGDHSEQAIHYLEPVTTQELSDALTDRGIPAQIIDGSAVGAPGWVIARTVGFAEGLAPRWAPEENITRGIFPTISFEDLASGLAQELNAPCHVADRPNIPSTHAHIDGLVVDINSRSAALLGQFRSTDGPLIAHTIGHDIWFAHGTRWSTVATEIPEANIDNMIGFNPTKPIISMERNGVWRRLTVVHNNFIGHHEWGPKWDNVDPRTTVSEPLLQYLLLDEADPAQFVFNFFHTPAADPNELAAIFNLDVVSKHRLELVLNSADMDDPFTAVARILGLPEAAAEIAEGWRAPHELPNGVEVLHEDLPTAVWSSATTTPTEKDFSSRIISMWLRRPPSYYVLNAVEALALGSLTYVAHKQGHRKTAVALAAITAVTVADFFVPASWRGQAKKY